jgi:hypothetical protein
MAQEDLIPGVGPNIVSQGASAALPDQNAMHAHVQGLIQSLINSRLGPGGGLTTGPEPAKPNIPLPPSHIESGGIPQGPFASVGSRQRADKQALFGTVKNIVDKAEDKHYQMKVQKIQHDFETLSTAIKGYNEAQTTGNQEMMKHNADIINQIVMDPKKSKELAKAFDVNMNPMAEDKKKDKPNPAADALKAAFSKDTKDFQSGQTALAPQAQAMMRQMPQTIQADPKALIMEQLTKSGVIPKGGEQLTFEADLSKIANNAMQHGLDRENKEKIAKMLGESSDRRNSTSIARVLFQVAGAKERAEILADAWKYRADKTLQGVEDRVKALKEKTSGAGDDKAAANAIRSLKAQADTLKVQIAAAAKSHDSAKVKQLQEQLDGLVNSEKVISNAIAIKMGVDLDAGQSIPGLSQEDYGTFLELFKDATNEPGSGDDEQ